MATAIKNPASTEVKTKIKREPVAIVNRITDQMKRAVLAKKLDAAELDKIATLANSLKVFIEA